MTNDLNASVTRRDIQNVAGVGVYAVLSVLAVTTLVGSETLFTGIALAWALSGMMHLPFWATTFVEGVAAVLAILATVKIGHMAWRAERILASAPATAD
ncbi:hypothetical protein [Hyphobacterium sp.]|uniref:hypothetical protein n=1 Tax=Hyphobacterium sp. TaxID=2004662 RepID=UPI003B525918